MKTKHSRKIFSPTQNVFVHFLKKLQEANELLKQPIVVSSVIDELRNKQQFFETSESEKGKRLNNRHHWSLGETAQLTAFQYTIFFQITVLDTVTKPQIKL